MFGHKDASLTLNRYGQHDERGPARLADRMSRAAEEAREQRRARQGHRRAI